MGDAYTYIFIGNQGSGKSTLINCLSNGAAKFKSGPSVAGTTQHLQAWYSSRGIHLVDTPGLANVFSRKEAANEIEKALIWGEGRRKVFFVVTLDAGRVKAADKATMKLVLEATPHIGSRYSIIVNMASPDLLQSNDMQQAITAALTKGLPSSSNICFSKNYPTLSGKKKAVEALDKQVVDFIYNFAPSVEITEAGAINYSKFAETQQGFMEDQDCSGFCSTDVEMTREASRNEIRKSPSWTGTLRKLAKMAKQAALASTIIMIGNPGVGKSTLLSCLVNGNCTFHSGIAIGKGLTAKLQEFEYNGNKYIDTPGLSDVALRKVAAAEIESALQRGGNFKVFFVVTLEAGRVKPDDITTIKLVLMAASQIKNNQFSIIVNKMSKDIEDVLLESQEEREELAACLVPPSLGTSTSSICFSPVHPEWTDKSDQYGELSPTLRDFINKAPTIHIPANTVGPIQMEDFDKMLEAMQEELRILREDNNKLREAIKQQKQLGGW